MSFAGDGVYYRQEETWVMQCNIFIQNFSWELELQYVHSSQQYLLD